MKKITLTFFAILTFNMAFSQSFDFDFLLATSEMDNEDIKHYFNQKGYELVDDISIINNTHKEYVFVNKSTNSKFNIAKIQDKPPLYNSIIINYHTEDKIIIDSYFKFKSRNKQYAHKNPDYNKTIMGGLGFSEYYYTLPKYPNYSIFVDIKYNYSSAKDNYIKINFYDKRDVRLK